MCGTGTDTGSLSVVVLSFARCTHWHSSWNRDETAGVKYQPLRARTVKFATGARLARIAGCSKWFNFIIITIMRKEIYAYMIASHTIYFMSFKAVSQNENILTVHNEY